jgi:hypothetical protein
MSVCPFLNVSSQKSDRFFRNFAPKKFDEYFQIITSFIKIGSGLETDSTAVGIRHADHVAPTIRKSRH